MLRGTSDGATQHADDAAVDEGAALSDNQSIASGCVAARPPDPLAARVSTGNLRGSGGRRGARCGRAARRKGRDPRPLAGAPGIAAGSRGCEREGRRAHSPEQELRRGGGGRVRGARPRDGPKSSFTRTGIETLRLFGFQPIGCGSLRPKSSFTRTGIETGGNPCPCGGTPQGGPKSSFTRTGIETGGGAAPRAPG